MVVIAKLIAAICFSPFYDIIVGIVFGGQVISIIALL